MTNGANRSELSLRQAMNGLVLRTARERAGYTLEQCAEWLHLAPSQLQAWESGSGDIPVTLLASLANRLRLPLTEFDDDLPGPADVDPRSYQALLTRIGEQLRETRKQARVGIGALANSANLPAERWDDVETGRTELGVAALGAVARRLGQPLHTFFLQAEEAPAPRTRTPAPVAAASAAPLAADPLAHLDPALRSWTADPANALYLETARQLAAIPREHMVTLSRLLLDLAAAKGK